MVLLAAIVFFKNTIDNSRSNIDADEGADHLRLAPCNPL